MKKYYIIIPLAVILILSFLSIPRVITRMKYESANNVCVMGIDISDVENPEKYKEYGVNTAVICEEHGGFDRALLERAGEIFPSVALEFNADRNERDGFLKILREAVFNYNVEYLILKEGAKKEYDTGFVSALSDLIREKSLICVLKENKGQNGNELPYGIKEFLSASDMRVLRAYETPKKNSIGYEKYDEIYFRMLNSAQDRNTEFLLINQLEGDEGGKHTLRAVGKFTEKLRELNKERGENGGFNGYTLPDRYLFAIPGAIFVLGILFLYLMFLKKADKRVVFLLSALTVVVFILSFILPENVLWLYVILYAASAPCFVLSVIYRLSGITKFPVFVIPAAIFTLLVFAIPLGAVLSGSGFHLGFYTFRQVVFALIIPLVFAGGLWCYKYGAGNVRKTLSDNKLLSVVVLLAVSVYLIRSGNSGISVAERFLRDCLSDVFTARPRIKEFLIGWPSLCVLPYVLKKEKSTVLTGLVLFGCTVLFSSVINSFCHGFTDLAVTFKRLCSGFVMAVPLMLLLRYRYTDIS